jgi:ADP-ribose pyrophosphatase YjhB (NUDIX family)
MLNHPAHRVALALIADGRVLLGRHGAGARNAPGSWDVVSGEARAGEAPEAALRRMALAKISVAPEAPERIGSTQGHDPAAGAFRLEVFAARGWSGGPPRLLDSSLDELRWCDVVQLAVLHPLAHERHRALLLRLLEPPPA